MVYWYGKRKHNVVFYKTKKSKQPHLYWLLGVAHALQSFFFPKLWSSLNLFLVNSCESTNSFKKQSTLKQKQLQWNTSTSSSLLSSSPLLLLLVLIKILTSYLVLIKKTVGEMDTVTSPVPDNWKVTVCLSVP